MLKTEKQKTSSFLHLLPAPESRTGTEHVGVAIHTLQSGNFLVNSAWRQAEDNGWAAAPGVTSSGSIYMTRLQTVFTRLIRTTRPYEAWWSGRGHDASVGYHTSAKRCSPGVIDSYFHTIKGKNKIKYIYISTLAGKKNKND